MNYADEFLESRVSQPLAVVCVSGTCHQWTVCGSQCAGYYTLWSDIQCWIGNHELGLLEEEPAMPLQHKIIEKYLTVSIM